MDRLDFQFISLEPRLFVSDLLRYHRVLDDDPPHVISISPNIPRFVVLLSNVSTRIYETSSIIFRKQKYNVLYKFGFFLTQEILKESP